MKKLLPLLLLLTFCFSCVQPTEKKKHAKSVKVKCYKQRNPISDNNPANDWIFWYLILNNTGGCSYYSNYSQVSDYSTINWSKSNALPEELNDKENVQEQPEQQVEVNDLSEQMQTEIDTTPENYEGMTYEELGDYENSTQDIDNNSESSDNSSTESSGDSGGDSGDGDSGGGGE